MAVYVAESVRLPPRGRLICSYYAGHSSTVWGVATDPSGNRIASVSDDKNVLIWQRDAKSHDGRCGTCRSGTTVLLSLTHTHILRLSSALSSGRRQQRSQAPTSARSSVSTGRHRATGSSQALLTTPCGSSARRRPAALSWRSSTQRRTRVTSTACAGARERRKGTVCCSRPQLTTQSCAFGASPRECVRAWSMTKKRRNGWDSIQKASHAVDSSLSSN